MSFLKRRSTRFYVGLFLILTMALWSLPTTALADSGGATVSVNAGTLSEIGIFGRQASITLNGKDQGVILPLDMEVTDATGSGAGWNLQISGTPLSDASGHTLIQQANGGSFGCAPGSTCTIPIATPIPVTISKTPQTFFSVAPNSGMGTIDLSLGSDVSVPANAFAGTYTSTLTLAVVSGP